MKSRGYEKPLYILPFDHRHSFQTKLFGWIGDLNADQTAQMAEARVNHERQIHRKSGSYHRRVDRYRFSHGQTIRPGRDGSCILITGRRKVFGANEKLPVSF
jgi:hypothetical protein